MAKKQNTVQREEKHIGLGSLKLCSDYAYNYAKELEAKNIDYKVNDYFFHDGVTQKGYKVIPFDNVSTVKVFKISGDIEIDSKEISTEEFKKINEKINVKSNIFIKFTNLLKTIFN